MTNRDDFAFDGFDGPNGTIVPDVFFDYLAPHLSEAELRVLLYILRRTFGFKKNADDISLSQMVCGITKRDGNVLDYGAGVQRAAASRAVKGLELKGIILAERHSSAARGNETTTYRLRFKHPQDPEETTPSIAKRPGGSLRKRPALVSQRDPQETGLQETDLQETDGDLSKLRKGSRQALIEGKGGETVSQPVASQPRGNATLSETLLAKPSRRSQKPISATLSEQVVSTTIPPISDAATGISEPRTPAASSTRRARGLTSIGDMLANASRQVSVLPTAPTARPAEQSDDASPEYIENVIRDLSHEFSDAQHIRANATQALHLWQQSGLSVKAFVEVVYSVRRTTRLQTDVKRRMPYCFKLLRVELGLAPNPRKNQPAMPAGQSSPPSATPTSLAGRYAHLVKRSGG